MSATVIPFRPRPKPAEGEAKPLFRAKFKAIIDSGCKPPPREARTLADIVMRTESARLLREFNARCKRLGIKL